MYCPTDKEVLSVYYPISVVIFIYSYENNAIVYMNQKRLHIFQHSQHLRIEWTESLGGYNTLKKSAMASY